MKQKELIADLTARGFATRILNDTVTGHETDRIDIHHLSFQEINGKASIIRSIQYYRDTVSDECWYINQEPESHLEGLAAQKEAATLQKQITDAETAAKCATLGIEMVSTAKVVELK